MKPTIKCSMSPCTRSSEIIFRRDLLRDPEALINDLFPYGKKFAIIAADNIAENYGVPLVRILKEGGLEADLIRFPGGEKAKTREMKSVLEDELLKSGFGSDICIIALGGGVTSDLAGYIAATYCRGVPLITIPTSLMCMVDASIGGKNGVNTPYGKNMVGTIYPPQKILIDITFLQTLPIQEVRNGIVEMIKHGLIANKSYFDFLEMHAPQILHLDKDMENAIFESCVIKTAVVLDDEASKGKRNILNFGHTVGHALELVTHFSLAHGEAVALGILAESRMSMLLGFLPENEFQRIFDIFTTYSLPLQLPSSGLDDELLKAMILDKKSTENASRFVIIESIGTPLPCGGSYCRHVDTAIVKNALEWMDDALCCH